MAACRAAGLDCYLGVVSDAADARRLAAWRPTALVMAGQTLTSRHFERLGRPEGWRFTKVKVKPDPGERGADGLALRGRGSA